MVRYAKIQPGQVFPMIYQETAIRLKIKKIRQNSKKNGIKSWELPQRSKDILSNPKINEQKRILYLIK